VMSVQGRVAIPVFAIFIDKVSVQHIHLGATYLTELVLIARLAMHHVAKTERAHRSCRLVVFHLVNLVQLVIHVRSVVARVVRSTDRAVLTMKSIVMAGLIILEVFVDYALEHVAKAESAHRRMSTLVCLVVVCLRELAAVATCARAVVVLEIQRVSSVFSRIVNRQTSLRRLAHRVV
jgi:hypothetical protein